MYSAKELHKYTQNLHILYVEDNETLKNATTALFEPFFKKVDTAENGQAGLEAYNAEAFDLVITDINMPKMNGIEMIKAIKETNAEQKIVAISAHNESDILINLIKAGVSSFILKPIMLQEMITTLYPVCRDAYMQILNIELVNELNEERAKLLEQIKTLQAQDNTINTKHQQLEQLLQQKKTDNPTTEAYFAADEDEGCENVILISDHCDELTEIFEELPMLIAYCNRQKSEEAITNVVSHLDKASAILFHYTPYLDTLSSVMRDLSLTIKENSKAFIALLTENEEGVTMLFDAVSSDMERYVKRFAVESLAMRNTHHIHEPTALSIQQIISMILPGSIEEGELEFF